MTNRTTEEIARGLTEAQKAFLRELPAYAVESYAPAKWLVHKQLAEWSGHRLVATQAGLAVRSHLESHPK